MPQLQKPVAIWLDATPDERDAFFLGAGFDPALPTVDNGTDATTVRFRQEPIVVSATPTPVIHPVAFSNGVNPQTPQAGDDLRDWQGAQPAVFDDMGGVAPIAAAGASVSVAGRALRLVLGGGGGRLTAAIWNSLPSIVRTALSQLGIGIGAMVAFDGDIPFITLPGQGGEIDVSQEGVGGAMSRSVDIQIGSPSPLQQVQVVGSWIANGVTFYRLADGKLAVQNKKGRWKVWRPKKPIVLYSDGASNLKTMLRADKALNKQARKIATMLNRRAPRRKTTSKSHTTPIILGNNARVVDV